MGNKNEPSYKDFYFIATMETALAGHSHYDYFLLSKFGSDYLSVRDKVHQQAQGIAEKLSKHFNTTYKLVQVELISKTKHTMLRPYHRYYGDPDWVTRY